MQDNTNSPNPLLVSRIIWCAFAMSIFVFVLAAFTVTDVVPPTTESVPLMAAVSGVITLLTFAAIPLMYRKTCGEQTLPLLRDDSDRSEWDEGLSPLRATEISDAAHAKARQALMVGLALSESSVLFGFSMAMLSTIPIVILPFAGVGLTGLLWQFPTEAGVSAIARAMRNAEQTA